MMHFHLDDDEEPVIRKVWFHDLVQIHMVTSPENQKKIREADEVARKKEQRANQKAKLIKDLSKNKKKKKLHADLTQ